MKEVLLKVLEGISSEKQHPREVLVNVSSCFRDEERKHISGTVLSNTRFAKPSTFELSVYSNPYGQSSTPFFRNLKLGCSPTLAAWPSTEFTIHSEMFCIGEPSYDKSTLQLQSFLADLISEEKLELRDGMYLLKKY